MALVIFLSQNPTFSCNNAITPHIFTLKIVLNLWRFLDKAAFQIIFNISRGESIINYCTMKQNLPLHKRNHQSTRIQTE